MEKIRIKRSLHCVAPVDVRRAGTPYCRLMQLAEVRQDSSAFGKRVTVYGFKSLVSAGLFQWSIMRTYWCYSGKGHEIMFVRRLPFRMAFRIEIGGQTKRLTDTIARTKKVIFKNIRLFLIDINPIQLFVKYKKYREHKKFMALFK